MRPSRPGAGLLALVALLGLGGSCTRDPLYEAVRAGDLEAVERLLAAGAEPNRVTSYTQSGHSGATFQLTPLVLAAQAGDVALIERLVAGGADPHWDDGQFTAFEWALRFGHPQAARRLWELSDGTTYAARGAHHLPLALRMGDDATLDFVLEQVGTDGCEAAAALAPLARSGRKGSEAELEHVRTLAARGVKPTPEALHWSVREARVEMTNLLLDLAEERGWAFHCLGKPTAPFDPLAGALRGSVITHETGMARLLLERGADPDAPLPDGATVAMLLTRHVYLKQVYGRPPHADPPEPTPSRLYEQRYLPLLELLLEHGADLSRRDQAGRSVVDYIPADDHDAAPKRALLAARAGAGGGR